MPPFGDRVSADPSFEEMQSIVCEENFRPIQLPAWHSSRIMSILARIQSECWGANHHARLSILRVKKMLKEAAELAEDEIGKKLYSAQMMRLIDEVPKRHEQREAAKVTEENEKKRQQEELRRKQQGNFSNK